MAASSSSAYHIPRSGCSGHSIFRPFSMPTLICRDGSGDHGHPPHRVRIDGSKWIDDARERSRGWGEMALGFIILWVGRRQTCPRGSAFRRVDVALFASRQSVGPMAAEWNVQLWEASPATRTTDARATFGAQAWVSGLQTKSARYLPRMVNSGPPRVCQESPNFAPQVVCPSRNTSYLWRVRFVA